MKKILCLLFSLVALLLAVFTVSAAESDTTLCPWEVNAPALAKQEGKLHYYFMTSNGAPMGGEGLPTLNWGSACLIVFPNGKTLLLDSGCEAYAPTLVANLYPSPSEPVPG